MFSGVPFHNGMRVTAAASTAFTTSSGGSSAQTVIISVRWIITSETVRSGRSSRPLNMSRSSFSTLPSWCRRSTAPRNSSWADKNAWSMPTRNPNMRRIQRTSASIPTSIGPNSRTTHAIGRATSSATRSGALIATVLGNTSVKTTTTTVMIMVA